MNAKRTGFGPSFLLLLKFCYCPIAGESLASR
jgi:hypothetical protein